jgi:hypothetical protein
VFACVKRHPRTRCAFLAFFGAAVRAVADHLPPFIPRDQVLVAAILRPDAGEQGRRRGAAPDLGLRSVALWALQVVSFTEKGQTLSACPTCNSRAALGSVSTGALRAASALARCSLSQLLYSWTFNRKAESVPKSPVTLAVGSDQTNKPMDDEAWIEAEVTFIPESEGGRKNPPEHLTGNVYRPHLVIGDPTQHQARLIGNFIDEEMLGIAFTSGPEKVRAGQTFIAILQLAFYPHPAYDALVPGTTFTIREGPKIVASGRVIGPTNSPRTKHIP